MTIRRGRNGFRLTRKAGYVALFRLSIGSDPVYLDRSDDDDLRCCALHARRPGPDHARDGDVTGRGGGDPKGVPPRSAGRGAICALAGRSGPRQSRTLDPSQHPSHATSRGALPGQSPASRGRHAGCALHLHSARHPGSALSQHMDRLSLHRLHGRRVRDSEFR